MRLSALEPRFLRVVDSGRTYEPVDSLEDAQGIEFLCPACLQLSGDPIGTHRVTCWFNDRDVPVVEMPRQRRWKVIGGTGIDDLSLTEIVEHETGCHWRGFIHNGQAIGA